MVQFQRKICIILKNRFLSIASILVLILIWKLFSTVIASEIILPSPESAVKALFFLIREKNFGSTIGSTVSRGISGFIISAIAALIVGIAAGENKFFYIQ